MLLKSGGGSRIRRLQTASQFHDRTAEEEEEQKCRTSQNGRRSSSYCRNMYLPPLCPQMSLITLRRRPNHAMVTHRAQAALWLLPRKMQVTSALNGLANQPGAQQYPSETKRVASVAQAINANRREHFLFLRSILFLHFPCSVCRHPSARRYCLLQQATASF